ncbi:ABC transporter permease, partial [Sutterella wadsworthensis]
MTAWFRHVAAAAQLEIQQVLTHPVEWLTAILAPLFWCAVLWFAFSAGTLSGLPVALVDLDQSAASRSVAQALDALPSIKLEQFENSLSADRALKNSKVFAVVTIPQDFETDRRRGAGA